MIEFLCDTCGRGKRPNDSWILGFAAEAVGVTATRRELTIAPVWDDRRAREWLAVHFCCENCRDQYMERLFGNEPVESEVSGAVEVPSKAGKKKVVALLRRERTVSRPVVASSRQKPS